MKPIIFNQRVTVFTNLFIGYSDANKNSLISKLGGIEEVGMLQPNFSVIVGPQQILSPNQIQQNAPWFIKVRGTRVEFLPNKIDIISDAFINTEEKEISNISELTKLLSQINESIQLGNIARIAYAPSLGLEGIDKTSVSNYWKSVIGIPDLDDSYKQEKLVRYNTPCEQDFGRYTNIKINRVVTIHEGQRNETRTNPTNGNVENRTIECVIVSIDINTDGNNIGNYSTDDVSDFCRKAQIWGREVLTKINND